MARQKGTQSLPSTGTRPILDGRQLGDEGPIELKSSLSGVESSS